MSDKGFLKYIGICVIYFFLIVAYCFCVHEENVWIQGWFSDKFFVFQYATIFLLGSALIKEKFNTLTYCRYGTRKKIILFQLVQHAILSLVLVTLLFFDATILTIVLGGATDFYIIRVMANWYCRFLIGSYMIGCLDMIIEYSGLNFFNLGSQICVFLVIATELLAFIPQIHKSIGKSVNILFSWIFFDYIIGYLFLFGESVLLTIVLFLVSNRGDLPT